MNIQTALLAGSIALASGALHADELQVTFSGSACPISILNCTAAQTSAFTIVYDVDTSSGQRVSVIIPRGPIPPSESFLGTFEATNLSIANFSAIVGGNTVASFSSATGSFGWILESSMGSPPWPYEFVGGVSGPSSFLSFDGFATFSITGDGFQTLGDPLAYMLSTAPHLSAGAAVIPGWRLGGNFTITSLTSVPTPGMLPLLLTGMAGVAIAYYSRGRRRGRSAEVDAHARVL